MSGLEKNIWLIIKKELDDSGLRNKNKNLPLEARIS